LRFYPTLDLSQVEGHVMVVDPMTACDKISNGLELMGKIAILRRGTSSFIVKARAVEKHGAIGGIIIGSNSYWMISG
jgi:mannosidase alpha-like ER degradation enhancer 3